MGEQLLHKLGFGRGFRRSHTTLLTQHKKLFPVHGCYLTRQVEIHDKLGLPRVRHGGLQLMRRKRCAERLSWMVACVCVHDLLVQQHLLHLVLLLEVVSLMLLLEVVLLVVLPLLLLRLKLEGRMGGSMPIGEGRSSSVSIIAYMNACIDACIATSKPAAGGGRR